MAGITMNKLTEFVKNEIAEYETALALVKESAEGPGKVQFSRVYRRKIAEYEGAINALVDVLEQIEGKTE